MKYLLLWFAIWCVFSVVAAGTVYLLMLTIIRFIEKITGRSL